MPQFVGSLDAEDTYYTFLWHLTYIWHSAVKSYLSTAFIQRGFKDTLTNQYLYSLLLLQTTNILLQIETVQKPKMSHGMALKELMVIYS